MRDMEDLILQGERSNDKKYERYMSILADKRVLALFGAG